MPLHYALTCALLFVGVLAGFAPTAAMLGFLPKPIAMNTSDALEYFFLPLGIVAFYLVVRYGYGKRGTARRSAASIALRSPQIPFALLCVHLLSVGLVLTRKMPASLIRPLDLGKFGALEPLVTLYGSVPSILVGCAAAMFYYGLRFGAVRMVSFLMLWQLLRKAPLLDGIIGVLIGTGCAFCVDMLWNWDLKRRHIMVPGFPRKQA